jgi:hypothetical protein
MSSLQKFHRRTQSVGAPAVKLIGSEAPVAGSGFYLGFAGDGTSYMYVAPKSTEGRYQWGSYGVVRGTVSTTDGVANTNALYAFGSSITTGHPAAYYCKTLNTGGYNTWYLPAKLELASIYSNRLATPFATSNGFATEDYWSSTEASGATAWVTNFGTGSSAGSQMKGYSTYGRYRYRAVRRSTI